MTKYIGPKTDGANVATQSDVGGSSLSDATPDALTPDQAGAAGTVNSAARADHAHEIICAAAGAILPDDVAAEGTASTFARSDHTHSISAAAPGTITPDAAAAEGSSTSFARADHTHAIVAAAPGTITPDAAAAEGSSSSFARADHTHAIVAASAGTITGTNAEGSSTSFARADHNHAYGTGSIPQAALALGPTYETSLPGSPTDGQEIYYAADATNGVIWHLRYRSAARSGSGAWEYVGGGSLQSAPSGSIDTTSTSYVAITSANSLTIPQQGTYEITWGGEAQQIGSAGTDADLGLRDDGTVVAEARVTLTSTNAGASSTQTVVEAVGTSKVLDVRGKTTTGGTTRFRKIYIVARPRFIY